MITKNDVREPVVKWQWFWGRSDYNWWLKTEPMTEREFNEWRTNNKFFDSYYEFKRIESSRREE